MSKISHIPKKLNEELNQNELYGYCILSGWFGHKCAGRLTRDHSFAFEGENQQRLWAINPVCSFGHGVNGYKDDALEKQLREWVALCRATEQDILNLTNEQAVTPLSKAMVIVKRKQYLIGKYGVWHLKVPEMSDLIPTLFA